MIRLNSTNLKQVKGGAVVKQGDISSLFEYKLLNEQMEPLHELDGKNATVRVYSQKGKVTFEGIVDNSTVDFKFNKVIPAGIYLVEVICDGYIFPSDCSTRIEIIKSAEQFDNSKDIELKKLDIKKVVEEYVSKTKQDVYDDREIKLEIQALKSRMQNPTVNLAPLEGRVSELESRPQAREIDLVPYLKTETAYTLFPTYSTLQAQMTSNIKTKHLELGLDALIEKKLKNGEDPFVTNHQIKTWYTSKAEFNALVARVQQLENKE